MLLVNDIAIWVALGACLIGGYFSACNIASKTFSKMRLSELLEEQGHLDRFEPFVSLKRRVLLVTGMIRACSGLIVLLAMLDYIERAYPSLSRAAQYMIVFVSSGVLVSIFNVAIPVSIARYLQERLLARSIPLLNFCVVLFRPITALLNLFDPLIRRVFDAEPQSNAESDLGDEILSVVEEHEDGGSVDEGQKEMIEAVVEFPTTTVGQIMTPRTDVHGIDIHSTLDGVRAAIHNEGHSRIPVYEKSLDHIVGILYAKDMIRFIGSDRPFDLRQTLRDALMVPESKSVRELLGEFKAKKVHIAIVLDEYGGTAGLVTIEDIIEEIVGEIQDEYEPTEDSPHIHRLDDQSIEVDARFHIDDLNDEMDLELPENKDYDTVGGFVFSTLGHIPEVGEQFSFEGVLFTVTAAERTRVNCVRLDLPKPSEKPAGHKADRPSDTLD